MALDQTREEMLLAALADGTSVDVNDIQPRTRKELMLAYICGCDGLSEADLPAPRTREELYLHNLCLGGSGGSGVSYQNNLLNGITWHVGEVNSSTGEISQTTTAANYTDLIDISEFACTFMEMNCDCTTNRSRMILYDADMNVISSFQATGVGRIPSDAKYARFSIYNGAGKTLEIRGDRFNFWDGEIMNGSYANSKYNPNDDPSCFVRCLVEPNEVLTITGCWGLAFLGSNYEVVRLDLVPKLENKKVTVPDGVVYAAPCAEDTWVDRCFCNRMKRIAFCIIE